jgi:hypothetical protein
LDWKEDFEMETEHVLYRFYGRRDQLLYIGITKDPPTRFRQHAAEKAWWHAVTRVETENFSCRSALEEAEREAIIEYQPLFNVVHNGFTHQQVIAGDVVESIDDRVAKDMEELVWGQFQSRLTEVDALFGAVSENGQLLLF